MKVSNTSTAKTFLTAKSAKNGEESLCNFGSTVLMGKLSSTKSFAANFANSREFSKQSAKIRAIRGKEFVVWKSIPPETEDLQFLFFPFATFAPYLHCAQAQVSR
jgi:hypothetical protein